MIPVINSIKIDSIDVEIEGIDLANSKRKVVIERILKEIEDNENFLKIFQEKKQNTEVLENVLKESKIRVEEIRDDVNKSNLKKKELLEEKTRLQNEVDEEGDN